MRRTTVFLALLVAPLVGGRAAESAPGTGASASGYAIKIVAPGQPGGLSAPVTAPPDRVAFGGGYAYPADGSILTSGSVTASASADSGTTAVANASAEVTEISLFGGEVTIASVRAKATATATNGKASGGVDGTSVSGFTVLGAPADTSPGARVSLGDWGYAIIHASGAVPSGDGYRGFVTAVDIRLTADHNGLPAGSQIVIGYAEATAKAAYVPPPKIGPPPKPKPPPAAAKSTPPKGKPPEVTRPKKGEIPPLVIQVPDIKPKLAPGGYVFPVYGPASYTNTFKGPRADTGWHHGEDIFAPVGAPVLAVTRGTVYSVGWNDIGGNRLWLRDAKGNEFYYAHLSAFSPLAVNGAHVNAGDVLGFVGTSGDAEGTPPHLHFEFHPVGLLGFGYDGVVDPNPWLDAWRRLDKVPPFAAAAGWAPPASARSEAPPPGAILLHSADISTANGLDAASLKRALAAPATDLDRPPTGGPRVRDQ